MDYQALKDRKQVELNKLKEDFQVAVQKQADKRITRIDKRLSKQKPGEWTLYSFNYFFREKYWSCKSDCLEFSEAVRDSVAQHYRKAELSITTGWYLVGWDLEAGLQIKLP